nr:MAG TPA: hypothetical protein [Caudoviricetes sp.]
MCKGLAQNVKKCFVPAFLCYPFKTSQYFSKKCTNILTPRYCILNLMQF